MKTEGKWIFLKTKLNKLKTKHVSSSPVMFLNMQDESILSVMLIKWAGVKERNVDFVVNFAPARVYTLELKELLVMLI